MSLATRYELSGDKLGLKKWIRSPDGDEISYHVHSNEMTELERWIHQVLLRDYVVAGKHA